MQCICEIAPFSCQHLSNLKSVVKMHKQNAFSLISSKHWHYWEHYWIFKLLGSASRWYFILKVWHGNYHFYVFNTWRLFLHKPRDPKQHNKVEKHGERRGGQKTPLGYLVFSRPGGSVSRWDIGTALRGCKPGACPPAGASSGLVMAVWAPAAVGAEAAGLGEAVAQHLCRPDSSHFVLVIVDSTFNHTWSPFYHPCTVTFNANIRGAIAYVLHDSWIILSVMLT